MTVPLGFLLLSCLLACATRGPRGFSPAGEGDVGLALAAWSRAVDREADLPAGRLLYDAKISQGPLRMSGTLAVLQGPGTLEATLSGTLGSPLAHYSDGALRGERVRPVAIHPAQLRWLLAGLWKGDHPPEVRGVNGEDALLAWSGEESAEGVLQLLEGRFKSLRVNRPEGGILATYSGAGDRWPEKIELVDLASGSKLRLVLTAVEPLLR